MSSPPADYLDLQELEDFNVHGLFCHYNRLYFEDQLGACSVQWSSNRMTLCAGVCEHQPDGGCRIKLSEPLLKLRPLLELKETLLHEMIHAYIFLLHIRDGDHGPKFQERMSMINRASFPDSQRPIQGYHITVYHSMHNEVNNYRTHHWRCQRCGNMVKRATNRKPQEADCRGRSGKGADCMDVKCAFHMHVKHCGGTYDKVAEPEGFGQKKKRKPKQPDSAANGNSGAAPKRRNSGRDSANGASITDFLHRLGTSSDAHPQSPEQQRQQQQQHQQQQQQQPPSRNDMRQLMADAAQRRLHGSDHRQASSQSDDMAHGSLDSDRHAAQPTQTDQASTFMPTHVSSPPVAQGTSPRPSSMASIGLQLIQLGQNLKLEDVAGGRQQGTAKPPSPAQTLAVIDLT